jgi:hypothetical protein
MRNLGVIASASQAIQRFRHSEGRAGGCLVSMLPVVVVDTWLDASHRPDDGPLDSISRQVSDLPVVPKCRRRTALISGANQRHFRRRPVPLKRGVSRSSRTLGVGCDGRDGTADERCHCGRRSRSVLIPRRWYQACGDPAGDGGKTARSPGRLRRKPLKPFVRGKPG